jgi:hypothetical protein
MAAAATASAVERAEDELDRTMVEGGLSFESYYKSNKTCRVSHLRYSRCVMVVP